MQRDGFTRVIRAAVPDLVAGPPGQRLPDGEPHAVEARRAAGGVAADAGIQRFSGIIGSQRVDVVQDGHQFIDGGGVVGRGVLLEAVDDFTDDLFEMDGAALVDGLHQPADALEMGSLAGGVVFQVEQLQAGDHALAVVEQLQDILHLQVGQVQGDPPPGTQLGQPAQDFMGAQPQQLRHVRRVAGAVRVDDLRILGLLQVTVHQRFQVHLVQRPDPCADGGLALGCGRGKLVPQGAHALLQGLHQLRVHEFCQVQLRFLPDPDVGQKLLQVDRRQIDAEALIEVQAVHLVELDEQEDHVLLLVAGGLAAGFHDGHHRRFG